MMGRWHARFNGGLAPAGMLLGWICAGCGGDSGVAATAPSDSGLSDAGLSDAGLSDAGLSDAGLSDAGSGTGSDAAVDGSGSARDAGDVPLDDVDRDAGPSADITTDAPADSSADAVAADSGADTETDSEPVPVCTSMDLRFGADLDPSGLARPASFGPCADAAHALVAAAGSAWSIEASGLPDGTVVSAYGPSFFAATAAGEEPVELAVSGPARAGIARVTFEVATAGEQVVVLRRPVSDATDDYSMAVSCAGGCLREATRFPIVLVHGYAGVDSYFGILDYFHDVKPTLSAVGYVAYTPVTDPIATSARRSAQLGAQIDAILAETGARKVNLVCHSQGGLDARLLVSSGGYADRVASITTIATPHGGIPLLLADFLSVQDFSPEAMVEFNAANPDQPGVRYWSWSSRSCGILEPGCRDRSDNELVDVLLGASYTLLLRFGENDGIVPTASMAWGESLGLLFADHFDEVGQIADGTPDGDPFDHRAFYLSEARRLRAAGL